MKKKIVGIIRTPLRVLDYSGSDLGTFLVLFTDGDSKTLLIVTILILILENVEEVV